MWALLISLFPDFPRELTFGYTGDEAVVSCNWESKEDVLSDGPGPHIMDDERPFTIGATLINHHADMR